MNSLEPSCPAGMINDTYPGDCSLYLDQNKNNICDYSENNENTLAALSSKTDAELKDLVSGTEMKKMNVKEVAELYQIQPEKLASELSSSLDVNVKVTDSIQLLHDNYGIGPEAIKTLIINIIRGDSSEVVLENEKSTGYNITVITIISVLLYVFSYLFVKTNKINYILHKKIWNLLLLITFIITALTSILVLLRLEYGIIYNLPFNITYWHIEIGYIMILISIFHMLEHYSYFKSYFKK